MNSNKKLTREQKENILKSIDYTMVEWDKFDYSILKNVPCTYSNKFNKKEFYNEAIIAADTETSKEKTNAVTQIIKKFICNRTGALVDIKTNKYEPVLNYVVAWTISIRINNIHHNLVTLYGTRPSEMVMCFQLLRDNMYGQIKIFFHNLAYDWTFLQRFIIRSFGIPESQLNTKANYPVSIRFENKIELRDSLILAQTKLEKFAEDMNAEHKKAVGCWDYSKVRFQGGTLTDDEKKYIEQDTLALAEALDSWMRGIECFSLKDIPYTSTGVPRGEVQRLGALNHQRDNFLKMFLDYDDYEICHKIYHGGFTHANRFFVGVPLVYDPDLTDVDYIAKCYDFASSYPFIAIAFPEFEISKYEKVDNFTVDKILDFSDKYAFMFKLTIENVELKENVQMPTLQFSKCEKRINPLLDNGRIMYSDYIEIWVNEIDLKILLDGYKRDDKHIWTVSDVRMAIKGYLPDWFRKYIFELFEAKTKLKGGDPVIYQIKKATLNSASYGLLCQASVKEEIYEDYITGEYKKFEGVNYEELEKSDFDINTKIAILEKLTDNYYKEQYGKYLNRKGTMLPYQWGQRISSQAMYNLMQLGNCVAEDGYWLYSDTDSCYATKWDETKVLAYNNHCKDLLIKAGFGPVIHNNREYWLGVAESEGDKDKYTEFCVLGAKRYAGRCKADNELHITVAGVPKKTGAKCLKTIFDFNESFIFRGEETGKLTHQYLRGEIREVNGQEIADSIDMYPCDYILDSALIDKVDFDNLRDLLVEEDIMSVMGD